MNFLKKQKIYLGLHLVFDGALGLSLVVRVEASHCGGFFGRIAQAVGAQSSVIAARGLSSSCLTGCRVWAQQLWHAGLVAVEFS